MIEKLIMWWVRRWSTSSLTRLEVHLQVLKALRVGNSYATAQRTVRLLVPAERQLHVLGVVEELDAIGYTLTKKD